MPHASCTLHCAVQSPQIVPSLSGDINSQSSHWNYRKWKFPIICLRPDRNFQFYLRPASRYCVILPLFQLPRNRYPERQILSCAMPTADESNQSAAGTLHPHRSAICRSYDQNQVHVSIWSRCSRSIVQRTMSMRRNIQIHKVLPLLSSSNSNLYMAT